MANVGDKVLAYWDVGFWFEGTIDAVTDDGLAITFDDGKEKTVAANEVVVVGTPADGPPEVDTRIQGRWHSTYYPGTVIGRCGPLVQIRWDDQVERWIGPELVLAEGEEPPSDPHAESVPEEAAIPATSELFEAPPGTAFVADEDVIKAIWRIHQYRFPESERPKALPAGGIHEHVLAALEEDLGIPFPNDLRTLLLYWGGAVGQHYFVAPERIRLRHEGFRQDAAQFGNDPVDADSPMKISSAGWVPFASDYGGAALSVDLDPGPAGKVGQVVQRYPGDDRLIAGSILELLNELADNLDGGEEVQLFFQEDAYLGLPEREPRREIVIEEAPADVVQRIDAAIAKLKGAVETHGGEEKLWIVAKPREEIDSSKLQHSPSPSWVSFTKHHGWFTLRVGADLAAFESARYSYGGRTNDFSLLDVTDPVGSYYVSSDFAETSGLPSHYLVFHGGWWNEESHGFAFDASKPNAQGEHPIVKFRPKDLERGVLPHEVAAPTFVDWLEGEVDQLAMSIASS